jgi:enterochelin esterase-like enzyme
MTCQHLLGLLALMAWPVAFAQAPTSRPQPGPVVLGLEDKPAFALPPKGFDQARGNIAHGQFEVVEYDSKTVGIRRKLNVYTPPSYSSDKKYNVLYLLHGIDGDETEWQRWCAPEVILDNLYADGKLAPMIVVFPNGRAEPGDRSDGNHLKHFYAFEAFTDDLLKDIIPFIESRYPVLPGREHRALAGYSMGGGQSLNIGLTHIDTFAWLGAFSTAPNAREPKWLFPNPADASRLKLLFIACGNQDGLIWNSQRLHKYLKDRNVPHVYHIQPGGHTGEVWRADLYDLAPLLFH